MPAEETVGGRADCVCLCEEYQVSEEAVADIRGFVERLKGAGILA